MAVLLRSVRGGGCHQVVAEERAPLGHGAVGRGEDRATLVAPSGDLVEIRGLIASARRSHNPQDTASIPVLRQPTRLRAPQVTR